MEPPSQCPRGGGFFIPLWEIFLGALTHPCQLGASPTPPPSHPITYRTIIGWLGGGVGLGPRKLAAC
ncbi:hypothetical protein ERY430_40779 [Erythrobacter sp. EC-HK427]|nr:hypothetical protein ERY430_40779 [Erythrobacter sp. EC-HK427]